jgi:thymidylate synthase
MVNIGSPNIIKSNSLPEAWSKIVRMVRKNENGTLQNLVIHVAQPKREVPKPLQKYKEQIESWALELQSTKPRRLPFTHGQRIYNWAKKQQKSIRLDQIKDFIVPMLLRNPKTKRAIAIVTDPSLDAEVTDDPIPALLLIQFGFANERLNVTAYFRAQEMYFFWVVNMFELITLQETVCELMQTRSPGITVQPGSITTFAFTAYINPIDLERLQKAESTTLAIERFGISQMKQKNLEGLLESALIEGDSKYMKRLLQILSNDKRKLDRIRDIDYKGLELWQSFLEVNNDRLRAEFRDLPNILRRVIFDLVSLDMGLEREERVEELRKRIESADTAMQKLVNALEQGKR